MWSRMAVALVLLCAGCAAPRVVRVQARFCSLAPPMSGELALTVER